MKFERKHAWLLLGVALWMVVTWTMFIKNLGQAYVDGEDRPRGYWVAHSILIVVNLVIAALLGRLGWQIHKAERSTSTPTRR